MLPRLYPILDVTLCRERGLDPREVLDAFLEGGATFLQLRDKSPSSAARLAMADAVVARTHAAGGRLIVNDRADIARLSGADGVHVGQDDLPLADVRAIVGADAILGLSTHDERQVASALLTDAGYIAVGPVFGTTTKETGYPARGLDLVRRAAAMSRASARPCPIVAIGGITLENAADVIGAGASSVAVISDLLTEGTPAPRVRAFLDHLSGVRGQP